MFNLHPRTPAKVTALSLRQNQRETPRIATTSLIMGTASKGRPTAIATAAIPSRKVILIHTRATANRRAPLPAGLAIVSRNRLTQSQSKVAVSREALHPELQRKEALRQVEVLLRQVEVLLLQAEAVQSRGLLLQKHPDQDKEAVS